MAFILPADCALFVIATIARPMPIIWVGPRVFFDASGGTDIFQMRPAQLEITFWALTFCGSMAWSL
jgi:hypothetical protein